MPARTSWTRSGARSTGTPCLRALAGLRVRTWSLGQDAKVRGALILALQQTQGPFRRMFTSRGGAVRHP